MVSFKKTVLLLLLVIGGNKVDGQTFDERSDVIQCSRRIYTCLGACSTWRSATCGCDLLCIEMGDCCFDFLLHCSHLLIENVESNRNHFKEVFNATEIEENVIKVPDGTASGGVGIWTGPAKQLFYNFAEFAFERLHETVKHKQIRCMKFSSKNESVKVVTSCLDGSVCKFNYRQWGRHYVYHSDTIYVNRACGMCNGAVEVDMKPFVQRFHCDSHIQKGVTSALVKRTVGLMKALAYLEKVCVTFYTPDNVEIFHIKRRMCHGELTKQRQCASSEGICKSSAARICHIFVNPYTFENYTYKNIYCALCDTCLSHNLNDSKSHLQKCQSDGDTKHSVDSVSFSVLLDFKGRNQVLMYEEDTLLYRESMRYTGPTINTTCSYTHLHVNGSCHALPVPPYLMYPEGNRTTLALAYVVKHVTQTQGFIFENLLVYFPLSLRLCHQSEFRNFFPSEPLSLFTSGHCQIGVFSAEQDEMFDAILRVWRWVTSNDVTEFLALYFTNNYGNDVFQCVNGKMYQSESIDLTEQLGLERLNLIMLDVGYAFTPDIVTMNLYYTNDTYHWKLGGCLSEIQLCPLYVYNYEKEKHGPLLSNDFLVDNTTMLKCDRYGLDLLPSPTNDPVLKAMTFGGSVVSLSSITITITIYSAAAKLRTLPGKLLLNYMTVLAIAQITFQWNDDFLPYPKICKFLGAVQHVTWLMTFTTMTAFAHKLSTTFTDLDTGSLKSFEDGSYPIYTLISLGIPTAIVVLCGILDGLGTGLFHYGTLEACWISNEGKLGILYMFGCPILILISVNCILFIRCILALYRLFQTVEMAASERNRRRHLFAIYFRLFSMMDVMWLFGFLPPLTGIYAFWYPFVIFNSLQGLYVFLAFGLSAQAREFVANIFRNIRNNQ